jgi:hypothetical protein
MFIRRDLRKLKEWPAESREATQLVIRKYGEPDEITDSQFIWHEPGPWKRIVASRQFYRHDFPIPHIDAVESVINYRVPINRIAEVAEFDGSIVVERTAGEVSARCHGEEANFLAINLMHDIVMGTKTSKQAREYYVRELTDRHRGLPTPYMDTLRFMPTNNSADPDCRVISDAELVGAIEDEAEERYVLNRVVRNGR